MPVLKHAKKKMRQDKRRTLHNKQIKTVYRDMLKKAKAQPTLKNVSETFSSLDIAVKHNIIHKNKAARLKSSLSKLLPSTSGAKTAAKKEVVKKPTVKKAASKKVAAKAI